MKKQTILIIPLLYQFGMLFAFISKIRIGPVSLTLLVRVIALFVLFYKWKKVKLVLSSINGTSLKRSLILLFGLYFITLIHSMGMYGSDVVLFEPSRVITLIIGVLVMGLWCAIELKTFERFAYLVIAIMIIQSLCSFLSIINPSFQTFLAENFMPEGFVERSEVVRVGFGRSVGLGIGWSSGALVLAYGCFVLLTFRLEQKINTLWFVLLLTIIVVATAFMGRTGLIVELGMLLFYALFEGIIKNIFSLVLVSIVGVFLLGQVLSYYDAMIADDMLSWMFDFKDRDAIMRTNEGIYKDGFPEFSTQYIFGTGVMVGMYNGHAFFADSGYIRSYTSVGVVGMILYYLGVFFMIVSTFTKRIPKKQKRLLYVGLLFLFVAEYKEPFIGMVVYPWVLFTTGLLLNRKYRSINHEYTNSGRLRA